MVIRVRRQTAGEVDAPAIQQLAAGRDSDEHRRVTVLGGTGGRVLHSRFRHVLLPLTLKIERRVAPRRLHAARRSHSCFVIRHVSKGESDMKYVLLIYQGTAPLPVPIAARRCRKRNRSNLLGLCVMKLTMRIDLRAPVMLRPHDRRVVTSGQPVT